MVIAHYRKSGQAWAAELNFGCTAAQPSGQGGFVNRMFHINPVKILWGAPVYGGACAIRRSLR